MKIVIAIIGAAILGIVMLAIDTRKPLPEETDDEIKDRQI